MTIGIYHKGCIDGTMAAAILCRKFPEAKVYPLNHHYAPSDLVPVLKEITEGSKVYILDCALGVREVLERNVPVTIVDHHISVHEELQGLASENPLLTYVFDNTKSGASLSWSYFFPDLPTPRVVELVADQDLWIHAYGQETKDINSYLMLFPDKPHEVAFLLDGIPDEVKKGGALISQYVDMLVQQFSEIKPLRLHIGKHSVCAYNVTTAQSQVGNLLSTKMNAAVCLFMIQGDHVKISFRSEGEHYPSALDLALLLGGGGHVKSSGTVIPLSTFLSMLGKE